MTSVLQAYIAFPLLIAVKSETRRVCAWGLSNIIVTVSAFAALFGFIDETKLTSDVTANKAEN